MIADAEVVISIGRWLTADISRVTGDSTGKGWRTPQGTWSTSLQPRQRCPCCHGDLTASDSLVACSACLTVGHDDVLALPSVPGPSVVSRDD